MLWPPLSQAAERIPGHSKARHLSQRPAQKLLQENRRHWLSDWHASGMVLVTVPSTASASTWPQELAPNNLNVPQAQGTALPCTGSGLRALNAWPALRRGGKRCICISLDRQELVTQRLQSFPDAVHLRIAPVPRPRLKEMMRSFNGTLCIGLLDTCLQRSDGSSQVVDLLRRQRHCNLRGEHERSVAVVCSVVKGRQLRCGTGRGSAGCSSSPCRRRCLWRSTRGGCRTRSIRA